MKINSLFQAMRSWKVFGFGFLVAGLMVFGGTKNGHAELTLSGFGEMRYVFSDSPDKGSANTERLFQLSAELDIEKKMERLSVRVDLDFPSNTAQAIGITTTGGLGIEQARFDWSLTGDRAFKLDLTGGAFNSPIGFEAQDPPDKLQISNGQLFDLVTSNFLGMMLSGGIGIFDFNVIVANPWRSTQKQTENNTIGLRASLTTPGNGFSVSVGELVSLESGTVADDGDVFDLVFVINKPASLITAIELITDESNLGIGVVLNYTHEGAGASHWITGRSDFVFSEMGSVYGPAFVATNGLGLSCGSNDCFFQTLTLSLGAEFVEGLATVLEFKRTEGISDTSPNVTKTRDDILLQWVYAF